MRFTFDGGEFDVVERPTFEEISVVERQAGLGAGDFTDSERMMSGYLVSLRRAGVFLTWKDMKALTPADFEEIEEPDPTEIPDSTPGESQ